MTEHFYSMTDYFSPLYQLVETFVQWFEKLSPANQARVDIMLYVIETTVLLAVYLLIVIFVGKTIHKMRGEE